MSSPPPQRLLRLFLSSTFRDMQAERDILTRLVLPRQRAALAARNAALQEVDLRWGVTAAMNVNSGALVVCLREVASCFPLVIGLLGRRAGWIPPRSVLEAFAPDFAATVPQSASMTEIEMRYGAFLAQREGAAPIPVLVRSDRLSAVTASDETEWAAAGSFREWIARSPCIRGIAYDTLEEFERLVEGEVATLFDAGLDSRRQPVAATAVPHAPRLAAGTALEHAAATRRPTLVTGPRGSGISWLVRRWALGDPRGLYIDGRQLGEGDLASLLRGAPSPGRDALPGMEAETLTRALLERLAGPSGTRRVVLDHFEDGFASASRADLSWLPRRLPRGTGVVVVSREGRLREQASALNWRVHEVEEIATGEAEGFATAYLQQYSKQLSAQQEALLARAPWYRNLGSLVLALDELRRYGTFETLDQRIGELAGIATSVGLVDELIRGLVSVVPEPWKAAVEDGLIAIRISVRGLEEPEVRQAASAANASALPAHLWSAVRISLGSALVTRDALTDVGGGPLVDWLDGRLVADGDRVRRVAGRLRQALNGATPQRRWLEAPRLAELLDGEAGLERLLRDPACMQSLMSVGETFADGWLARLDDDARHRVAAGWGDRLLAESADLAGQLGLAAARAGERDAALQLLDGSQRTDSPEDAALVAFLRRDGPALERLARQFVARPDPRATLGLLVLASCAEAQVELGRALEKSVIRTVTQAVRRTGDPWLDIQLHLHAGQLSVMRQRWFWAVWSFAAAERAARRLGDVRLLCRALERVSAVQIERHRFRAARRAASECRELARQARLQGLEALAFERAIEIEQRRANWTEAYRLAERFIDRSTEGLCDKERALRALATLEARQHGA